MAARARRDPEATAALVVFLAAVAVAFPLYLVRGHRQWFYLDEWDFLAARKLTSVHDLFRPHNEHWSTLPIVVYRLLWHFVGLRSYVPYQIVVVALHLIAAVLLRRVMRRAAVRPWVATAAAGLFLLLGSGRQDIVWAFQMGFTGSLVFGLAHLLFSDHDGPCDRRDLFGIGFGLAGLLCSGVAVTMVIVVGLAVLVRRGWRAAAFNTAPLAIAYALWYVTVGHTAYRQTHVKASDIVHFVAVNFGYAFGRMGEVPGIGAALAVVLVSGLVVAWSGMTRGELRRRAAAPGALLLGSLVFLAITAYGRGGLGTQFERQSRYVHLVAAMTLPAIAVAADAVAQRWKALLPVVLVLFAVGIPGNIDAIVPTGRDLFGIGNPGLMTAYAVSPFATKVPRSVHPNSIGASEVTIGWLLDGVRSGRIPRPEHVDPATASLASLGLVLQQTTAPARPTACRSLTKPWSPTLEAGDVLVLRTGTLVARLVTADGAPSSPLAFSRSLGTTLRVEAGPVRIELTHALGELDAVVCRGA